MSALETRVLDVVCYQVDCNCIMCVLGQTVTSVAEEREHNTRLTKKVDEFVKIMNELGLPYPKQIGKNNQLL